MDIITCYFNMLQNTCDYQSDMHQYLIMYLIFILHNTYI